MTTASGAWVEASVAPLFLEIAEGPGGAGSPGLLVRANDEAIRQGAAVLEIPLPDREEPRLARRTDREIHGDGVVTWRGRVEGTGDRVVLTSRGGAVAGTVFTAEGIFDLSPMGPGWGLWRPVDLPSTPFCATVPETLSTPRNRRLPATAAPAADPARVDILILYTRDVREFLDGGLPAFLQHLVDLTNTTFRDSDIDAGLRLVGTAEVAKREVPDVGVMLEWLRSDPEVAALRDAYSADLVALIVDRATGFCGIGQMFHGGVGDRYSGFSVTSRPCAMGFIFPHEIGHNFGMHHEVDIAPPPEQVYYPWAYGHYRQGAFRTLMTYGVNCTSCRNIPQFSNPELTHEGFPIGVADERDNHRAANLSAPSIARYRGAPRGPAPPTGLSAVVLSPTEVALAWADHADDETGYQVEVRAEESSGWRPLGPVPADATSYTASGLSPDTPYRFRVRALRDGDASAYSEVVRVRTVPAVPAAANGLVAEPLSSTAVLLHWTEPATVGDYEVEVRGPHSAADRDPAVLVPGSDGAVVDGLEPSSPYTFRVRSRNAAGVSAWSLPASATTHGVGGPCVADPETLCLFDGRFEIRARWRNGESSPGHGTGLAAPAAGSQRTGLFSFFDPRNVELVVKMLDGRGVNGAFWLYYGALSDLEYWISVRDTEGDVSRTYHSAQGQICGRGDTQAFPHALARASGAGPFPGPVLEPGPDRLPRVDETAVCVPGQETLCLAGGRFHVTVEWEDPRRVGAREAGHVFGGVRTDRAGAFWFFRPDNLELALKILDGRPINGSFWMYWSGLSDVGYTIRVVDTETGTVREFENPPGSLCGGVARDLP